LIDNLRIICKKNLSCGRKGQQANCWPLNLNTNTFGMASNVEDTQPSSEQLFVDRFQRTLAIVSL
jgi:hypothetical protein